VQSMRHIALSATLLLAQPALSQETYIREMTSSGQQTDTAVIRTKEGQIKTVEYAFPAYGYTDSEGHGVTLPAKLPVTDSRPFDQKHPILDKIRKACEFLVPIVTVISFLRSKKEAKPVLIDPVPLTL
jgi:hypothetical protein